MLPEILYERQPSRAHDRTVGEAILYFHDVDAVGSELPEEVLAFERSRCRGAYRLGIDRRLDGLVAFYSGVVDLDGCVWREGVDRDIPGTPWRDVTGTFLGKDAEAVRIW